MKRVDFIALLVLTTIVLIIFYPVFYTDYLYTDEATQIWLSAKKLNYQTSVPQGRYLTYFIFEWLFTFINNIHDVIKARLFSLFGWIICLPVWYYILHKLTQKNGLPKVVMLTSMLYLICMPPFAVYIGWAACMQIFIACTSSLIGGYILYKGIKYTNDTIHITINVMVLSIAFGIVALFTYQNGFGCFLLPFFIHFITSKKISNAIYLGIAFTFFIYLFYFFLYKYSISLNTVVISTRSSLATDPIHKLLFFFSRPLANAFHFTFLFNEKSKIGFIVYLIIAAVWFTLHILTQKSKKLENQIIYLAGIFVFLIIIYLPSLVVKENYASHRTMFALDIIVFIMVAETIFSFIKTKKATYVVAAFLSIFMVTNAWYNFNIQFIKPLSLEFSTIKKIVYSHYDTSFHTIAYITPSEDTFEKKYGIIQSWDEFGIPSTAKPWTTEPLIKQLIFEKTGNRTIAENTSVKSWISKDIFKRSGDTILSNVLVIDIEDKYKK